MGRLSKNQMAGMRGKSKEAFYLPDADCLRKFNYSNGAGWKTSKKWEKKISFGIRAKKRG